MNEKKLTHTDDKGAVRMVDVGAKPDTERVAEARCHVILSPETKDLLFERRLAKGDAVATARLGGIMAAKHTANIIPLCHSVPLSSVEVTLEPVETGVEIVARTKTAGKTGVEMEAMTAVSVAALSLYDMCKGVERGIRITDIRLTHKSGGRSGTYDAE